MGWLSSIQRLHRLKEEQEGGAFEKGVHGWNTKCKRKRRKKAWLSEERRGTTQACVHSEQGKQCREMRCMQKCSRREKKGGLCVLGSKGGMESKPETEERRGYRENRRLWWRGRVSALTSLLGTLPSPSHFTLPQFPQWKPDYHHHCVLFFWKYSVPLCTMLK